MKVYQGFEGVGNIPNAVVTIGTFDGVHLGHQKIIQKLNAEAEKIGGESVLFTFFPHPRMVIFPDNHGLKLIQTQAEKIENLRALGLKHLIVFPFTMDFANVTADDFVKDYLIDQLRMKVIVVGYDHQFGKNRQGTLEHLKKLSHDLPFQVIEIPAHEIDEVDVSSTKIRQAIMSGDIKTANLYLDQPFELSGKVVYGKALGRTIGYPTANIQVEDPLKIIPRIGIYAVKVELEDGRMVYGMLSIGTNPTVTADTSIKIEVYIFDFSEDLYGQKIKLYLLDRIRDEFRFQSVDELVAQLHQDDQTVRAIFNL